jgi:hypothetical protein
LESSEFCTNRLSVRPRRKPGAINASSKVDFVVNLRTARALGLAISPDFLSGANEVIE